MSAGVDERRELFEVVLERAVHDVVETTVAPASASDPSDTAACRGFPGGIERATRTEHDVKPGGTSTLRSDSAAVAAGTPKGYYPSASADPSAQ